MTTRSDQPGVEVYTSGKPRKARSRHSTVYEQLAIHAGTRTGMKDPTDEAVAEDPDARAVRDAVWGEYERLLRDDQTYTIDALHRWCKERGCTAGRSSCHRDRRAVLSRDYAITLAAEKARAVIDAASESGEHDVLKGGRVLAGQIVFNALSNLSAQALSDLDAGGILRMVDVLSKLSKAHAETDLIRAKLDELQRKYDEAAKAAQRKAAAGDGGAITDEMIQNIREAVFGSGA